MNQTKRNEILNTMVQIGKQVDSHIDITQQERENITYYQDFKFNGEESNRYKFGVEGVYSVETPAKKERKNEDIETNSVIYELYDKDKNLIATVTEDGKLHFTAEYIESLKEIDPIYFEQLNLEDLNFELPEELQENDITMTREELQNHENRQLAEDKIGNKENVSEQKIDEDEKEEQTQDDEEGKKTQAAEALGIDASEIKSICTINPREKITDKHNLIDIMPEAQGYDEVSIVCSNPNDKSQGRFTMLGVTNGQKGEDGKNKTICTPLTSVEPVEGTSTGKDVISVNEDGTKVTEKQVQGLFRINSRGRNDGISVSIGSYGMMDVDYVSNVMDKEHRRSTPIRTKGPENVRTPNAEVRENAGDSIDEMEQEGRIFRAKEEKGVEPQSLDGIDVDRADGGEMTLEELEEHIKEKTLEQGDMSKAETREFIQSEIENSGLELSDGEIEHATDKIEAKVLDESRFEAREYRG